MFKERKVVPSMALMTKDAAEAAGLVGKNLQQIDTEGLMTFSDDPNKLFRPHEDGHSIYLIAGGYRIPLSKGAQEHLDDSSSVEEILDKVAACVIRVGVSTIPGEGEGRPWCRLSEPDGVRLGEFVKLGAAAGVDGK